MRMSTTIMSSMFEIMLMSTTITSSMFEIMMRHWASTVKAAQQAAPCPHACGRKAMRKTAMFVGSWFHSLRQAHELSR